MWKVVKSVKADQNVCYHNITGEAKKDTRNAWMKAIAETLT